MIKATIRYGKNFADIEFPCPEDELQAAVELLHPKDCNDMELFISTIHYPKDLAVLQNRFINLDELNYLGRRLHGFFGDEYPRFAEAIKLEDVTSVREMINIACNISRYVLITDVSDIQKVGQEYVLQTEECLPAGYETDPKYADIGRKLMQSGKGIVTDSGILFVNSESPPIQQYNGSAFPQYLDNPNCLVIAEISYQGQTEYANLPVEELALKKAVQRLGATSLDECSIALNHLNSAGTPIHVLCDKALETEGLSELNYWATVICNSVKPGSDTFNHVLIAAGADSIQTAATIADNLGFFRLAKGVKNQTELGKWWMEHCVLDPINSNLEQFFDYKAYGEHLSQFLDVHYLESGDCVFLDGTTMDEVLGIAPAEDVGMGGLQ